MNKYIKLFEKTFQYPQADRRGCNAGLAGLAGLADRVSVSTSGSKGVQLRHQNRKPVLPYGFSIHKRIEGGATVWKS